MCSVLTHQPHRSWETIQTRLADIKDSPRTRRYFPGIRYHVKYIFSCLKQYKTSRFLISKRHFPQKYIPCVFEGLCTFRIMSLRFDSLILDTWSRRKWKECSTSIYPEFLVGMKKNISSRNIWLKNLP